MKPFEQEGTEETEKAIGGARLSQPQRVEMQGDDSSCIPASLAMRACCGWDSRAPGKSGGGPPHSKTLARFTMTPKPRAASWTAPVLWRFFGKAGGTRGATRNYFTFSTTSFGCA
jgi:hypothetical protein